MDKPKSNWSNWGTAEKMLSVFVLFLTLISLAALAVTHTSRVLACPDRLDLLEPRVSAIEIDRQTNSIILDYRFQRLEEHLVWIETRLGRTSTN